MKDNNPFRPPNSNDDDGSGSNSNDNDHTNWTDRLWWSIEVILFIGCLIVIPQAILDAFCFLSF